MIKNNSEHTFIFPEIPVRAVCLVLQRLNQLHCWSISSEMLSPDSQTALVSIVYYIFLSSKHLSLFWKLGPFNTKSISIPTPFYWWILLHLIYVWEQTQMSRDNSQSICYIHARKQKKLYVKHQCSKKYWIFTFRAMNFFDIMAEAVLSIEKSCLVPRAFEHIL